MYGREGKDLKISAAGDAIINRRVSECEEENFLELVDLIRETDVGFVNLETILHDYEGYPNAYAQGTYMRSPKYVADELTWMGFDIFAVANNHIADYLHRGMLDTMEALEKRNIPYAGLGRNLGEARSPTYMDSPSGLISLVACSATFPPGAEAGEQRPDLQGRPGLSPLHLDQKFVVNEEWYEKVEELSDFLGLEEVKDFYRETKFPRVIDEEEDGFTFYNPGGDNLIFEVGDEPGVYHEMKEKDRKEILKAIEEADKQSDWVVFSIHFHSGENGVGNDHSVADYAEEFAHQCIDAGADMFFGHGSHVMRGIEIYKGKPIFYGLGNFFFQSKNIEKLPSELYEQFDLGLENTPSDLYDELIYDDEGNYKGFFASDMYWRSFIPIIEFKDEELDSIELYPINLGVGEPRSRRGRPILSKGEEAIDILNKLKDLSKAYETTIEIEGEKGRVIL